MHLKAIKLRSDRFPANDVYPFNLPFCGEVRRLEFNTKVVLFVGENGSGKSTLLEAIARKANIHIWKGFQRSRYNKNRYEESLYQFLELDWQNRNVPGAFFASELFKSFSELLDEWASSDPGILEYFGDRSLLTLSHGQSHMAFFRSRFGRPGLYLLDEPETALSPATQVELCSLINALPDDGEAQFIISTHSPILLALNRATIVDLDSPGLDNVEFHETSHYKIYRDFFRSIETPDR